MAIALSGRGKKGVTDINRLNGAEKAAIILLALGEEHLALWEALDDEEIKEISQAMSTLGDVSSTVVEGLLVEFVSGLSSAGAIMGSYEQTQRLPQGQVLFAEREQDDRGLFRPVQAVDVGDALLAAS